MFTSCLLRVLYKLFCLLLRAFPTLKVNQRLHWKINTCCCCSCICLCCICLWYIICCICCCCSCCFFLISSSLRFCSSIRRCCSIIFCCCWICCCCLRASNALRCNSSFSRCFKSDFISASCFFCDGMGKGKKNCAHSNKRKISRNPSYYKQSSWHLMIQRSTRLQLF